MSHTPTPWKIDADIDSRGPVILGAENNTHRVCDIYDWTYMNRPTEAMDNAAFIVQAVNSHEAMRSILLKIKDWLTKQAIKNEGYAEQCRFESLNEAYRADAKNYRSIVKEIDAALAKGKP